jgi:hypothetical protein
MNDETPSACELQCQTFRLAGVQPGCERATIALLCFILVSFPKIPSGLVSHRESWPDGFFVPAGERLLHRHYKKMRPCTEQSNDLAPLSPF